MKWKKKQTLDLCIRIMVKILLLCCTGQCTNYIVFVVYIIIDVYILCRNQMGKPMASVRPMQSMSNISSLMVSRNTLNRKWIPAEVWQKQGMSAQEMTLPLGNYIILKIIMLCSPANISNLQNYV